MAKKVKFIDYIKFFLFSVFVAFVVTILVGLLMGYQYILVDGWSAQQEIPYQSFILTYRCQKTDLHVNDFATMNLNGYVTHQVIGMKYDGYFEPGECYSWEMNGSTHHAYYGYQTGSDSGNITALDGGIPSAEVQEEELANMTLSDDLSTRCNLITMANSEDGNARKEYRNFEDEFVGKVIWHNYTIGRTMYILKDSSFRNRVLLLGIASCVIMVFVMSTQSDLYVGFYN